MENKQEVSTSTCNLSTIPEQSNMPKSKTTSNQADQHIFHVHCLSKKKTLKDKKYTSVDDIKKEAFILYENGTFNDDNAILTYLDGNNAEDLLTSVPDLPEKGRSKDLFIRFVHPACAMCSNLFGILDDQQLFQCSEVKCGEQYCSSCVQAIQGSPSAHQFVCITCKKDITPQRNMLIEKHIIWKSMCKLYGIQSLLDLKVNANSMFCYPILKNIEFRLIHLQSRVNSFEYRLGNDNCTDSDQQLKVDVNKLCMKLENLIEQIGETNQEMERRGIVVSDCLQKYKKGMKSFDRLREALINSIEELKMDNNDITNETTDSHGEHATIMDRMDNLNNLSSEQNVKAIKAILDDLSSRKVCLSSHSKTITSLLESKPQQITSLDGCLNKAQKKLEIISIVEEELNYLLKNLLDIEQCVDEYDKLLRDDKYPDIPGSKFIILLERLRVRTEELENSKYFPQTTQLKRRWRDVHGLNNEFKPKVIDLFKNVELDVNNLLSDSNSIYSLPYKVGVIGDGSVGKSALIMNLANIYEFSSMVDVERSTFGYLQFDTFIYKNPQNNEIIPVTFIDIEGATDTNKSQSIGNYIELINKADCDLYIIVFDRPFHDYNRTCQEHIERNLGRKCLLVRSKIDLLFNDILRKLTGRKYENNHTTNYHVKVALNEIKRLALVTSDDSRLGNKIYLTAAACNDDLKDPSFATFDMDELKKELLRLAIADIRAERICKLAILASRAVVNICFRRGYVVSKTLYRWLAAGASIIPFLDELPSFFGREKIRQAFGIHDNSAITNKIYGTKDSFEEYLMKRKLTVPENYLKSGYFKYLRPVQTKQITTTSGTEPNAYIQQKPIYNAMNNSPISQTTQPFAVQTTKTVAAHTPVVLGAVGTMVDDAIRIAIPSTSVTLRAISITGIVVGAVLSPVFAAWTFYYTGKRMNKHVHLLCDDLMIILIHFIIDLCNNCCKSRQMLAPPSSTEDSSSTDTDSSSSDDE